MDRYWFLTNTGYGNWLPGDQRGFVGQVWEHRPYDPEEKNRVRHDLPGTPYDENIPKLEIASRDRMLGPAVQLATPQAEVLLKHFRETASFRHWELLAIAIMYNHFHIVVGVEGDPNPSKILGDFKSWGTRALTNQFGEPPSKTWRTERGSKRKMNGDQAIAVTVHYVLFEQYQPLITWSSETRLHYGPLPTKANVDS